MKYLNNMSVFVRIVESGSISAAAEQSGMSKSVISQHLKNLEEALGVTLLQRSTRRQVLTPEGQTFYQSCQQITQIAQQAWDSARESQETPRGQVVVTAPHALISRVVAPATGSLKARYPGIQLVLKACDQRQDLLKEKIDLAIRVGESADSNYRQKKIGAFRDILCAAPSYLKTGIHPSIPAELDECLYVAHRWQGHIIKHLLLNKYSSGHSTEVELKAGCEADSVHGVQGLIEAGAGIGIVPEFLFEPARQAGRLVELLPDYQLPSILVYAFHAYQKEPPRAVRLCMNAIEQQLQQILNRR